MFSTNVPTWYRSSTSVPGAVGSGATGGRAPISANATKPGMLARSAARRRCCRAEAIQRKGATTSVALARERAEHEQHRERARPRGHRGEEQAEREQHRRRVREHGLVQRPAHGEGQREKARAGDEARAR